MAIALMAYSVGPAYAEAAQEVQIEVIAFAFTDARPSTTGQATSEALSGTALSSAGSGQYQVLPDAVRKLVTASQRLQQDSRTQLLTHVAWRQGLYDQRWVRVDGEPGFEGRVLLRPGKPLSLTVQLREATTASEHAELSLSRPTHYGENQYFDHPRLAAIVRVDAIVDGEIADSITVESD